MAEDIQISDGDHILGADNNYLRTNTSAAKVYRCFMARLGLWPGGRGDTIGNAFHLRDGGRPKDTPETRQNFIDDGIDALQPLVDDGAISDVSVTVEDGDRIGRVQAVVTWFDMANQREENIIFPVPWGV